MLIATATDTHADLLEQAVAAGKPVLCEKPIDLSLARVNRCAEAIRGARDADPVGFVAGLILDTKRSTTRFERAQSAICIRWSSPLAIPALRPKPI